jgi:hypothetical protein
MGGGREGGGRGVREEVGEGGEMTQTLYAHMNKIFKILFIKSVCQFHVDINFQLL